MEVQGTASFSDGNDGTNPYPGVVLDSTGALYGMALLRGAYRCGIVFELEPGNSG
jgi:hypothetical protein